MINISSISEIETPFYLYDLDLLESTVLSAALQASRHDFSIHYALKANHEEPIVQVMKNYGFGIDCVSGNELQCALASGFDPSAIVFAGVGKTDLELTLAIENEILTINCESLEELQVIAQLARQCRKIARVAIRINPGIDARTHRNITTGLEENKFGIPLSQLKQALEFCRHSNWLRFTGLHVHIGSQITSTKPYTDLCQRVNDIWQSFDISSYGGKILNMGGGLGVDYSDPLENPIADFEAFFNIFSDNLKVPQGVKVHFELGRSLVAQCGQLITKVLYVKKGENKEFVITDAGMTELLRPALYQAVHKIVNLNSQGPVAAYDVAGPVCESSDVFGKDVDLPLTQRGHLLAVHSCGAYAQSMSLRYNQRTPARAYYISKNSPLPELSGAAELFQSVTV